MTTLARSLRFLALALPAALACAALSAGAAHAATSVSCSGDETGGISPNLTNTPQTVTYTLDESLSCSSSTHPTITAGAIHTSSSVPLATCSTLTGGGPRIRTYVWNTGETSTATYVGVSTTGPGNALTSTRTGLITGGKFLGALAVEHIATSADLSLCSGTGIPGYDGDVDLTITGLL